VNFAVDVYTGCTLAARPGRRICLRSLDLGVVETYASLDELCAAAAGKLTLLAHLVRFFAPERGVNLTTTSQAPSGAGLAGSSALMIAVAAALAEFTGRACGAEALRRIAQDLEARVIGVPTGCQDYYPALYGGANAIELEPGGPRRVPIPAEPDEWNARFVLAYTGAPRRSGVNNWAVMKARIDGDKQVKRNFGRIAAIARQMRDALAAADWEEAGRLLREEWKRRRANSPGISTPLIDRLVAGSRRAGALGAKVCGAGGGGCVVFLVEPEARHRVCSLIESLGATVIPARLASGGVRVERAPR
jgi:D-glycero-alpha-D-manno-heptose-7-phosphate kinase